jgi:hypothetical protein
MVLEYCSGGLQEMLEHAPEHKFTVWQAHWSVTTTNICMSQIGFTYEFLEGFIEMDDCAWV